MAGMTKQELFLYAVQTAVLTNGINLTSSTPERAEKYRHEYSATGVLGLMDDAIWASERIPSDMSAAEAAMEFCNYMFSNIREMMEEAAAGGRLERPVWFARG